MDQANQQTNHTTPLPITDWGAVNREWKESVLTQQAFCRERELCLSTFLHNRSKLLEKQGGAKHRKFTEVKLHHRSLLSSCQNMTVHLPNNIHLSIPPEFTSHQIKMVLGALGMHAC